METNTLKIVVANQKGGTGKSTVAINLAIAIQKAYDGRICLIDTDTQSKTTSKFSEIRWATGIFQPKFSIKPSGLVLNNIISSFDYVVVDTGGFSTTETKAFIATADIVLLPRSEERRVGKKCRSRWSPDQ